MAVEIDLLEHELKGNWLAKPKPDRDAIRAKRRAEHLARVTPKPASPETMARAQATYEDVRSRDPTFDPKAFAEALARRLDEAALADAPEIPVVLQLVAWAKAIMVLDASEVLIRDLIERDLVNIAGSNSPTLILSARKLAAKVADIRLAAIKTAFRVLRDRLGDYKILDHSLASWASAFSASDRKNIETAIQVGLTAGLDNTEIARRVVGSMALNGVDGVTEYTRHKIAHLGRAAIKSSQTRGG